MYVGGDAAGSVVRLTQLAAAQPPPPELFADAGPATIQGIAVGDFKGARYFADGSQYSHWVQLSSVTPDGGIVPFFSFDASNDTSSAISADFDGDGHLDVAFTVLFFGIATFTTKDGPAAVLTHAAANDGNLLDLVAADFDNDGDTDLIQATDGRSIGLYLNERDGGFRALEVYDAGIQYQGVAAADFDFDGRIDVAAVQGDQGHVLDILLNKGDHLELAMRFGAELGLQRPTRIVSADFDGDGLPDVALSEYGPWTLTVFRNTTQKCSAPVELPLWSAAGCSSSTGAWPAALLLAALKALRRRSGAAPRARAPRGAAEPRSQSSPSRAARGSCPRAARRRAR
jgi:hypothetical protein